MVETAAILSCLILALLVIFQAALVLGAPIGNYAWGGAHTVLPLNLRIGSAISIVLYGIFAFIILNAAGLVTGLSTTVATTGIWVLTVYFFLGVGMNGISRSKPERNMMTPVALILATTCLIIAMN